MASEKIKEKIKDKNGKIYYNPKGAFVSRRNQNTKDSLIIITQK